MSTNVTLQSSIQSLPASLQRSLPKLAVLQGGGNLVVVSHVMRSESVEAAKIEMDALVTAGLAEEEKYTYYRLDAELLSHLGSTIGKEERQVAFQHWLAAMDQLLGFLYQQYFEDNVMATALVTSERQNLMAYLAEVSQAPNLVSDNAPQVMELLKRMETLLKNQEAPTEKATLKPTAWLRKGRNHTECPVGLAASSMSLKKLPPGLRYSLASIRTLRITTWKSASAQKAW